MLPTTSAQRRIHQAALQLFAERGVTQVSISELAEAAGVARGTIYNNLKEPELLFERVATELAEEMDARIELLFAAIDDPALRLATGMRLWVQRAHGEPHWGRFVARFAMSNTSLRALWKGPPVEDMARGIRLGRYMVRMEQLPSIVAMVGGTVLGAVLLVLEGHRTWRDAAADAAEFVLVALGIPREEARALAAAEMPVLPDTA